MMKTPQGKVFWPMQSNSKVSEVPEDSQIPILGVWVSSSHFSKSGVVTEDHYGTFFFFLNKRVSYEKIKKITTRC